MCEVLVGPKCRDSRTKVVFEQQGGMSKTGAGGWAGGDEELGWVVSLGYWDLEGSAGRPEQAAAWKAEQMDAGEICTRGREEQHHTKASKEWGRERSENASDQKHERKVAKWVALREGSGTKERTGSGLCRGRWWVWCRTGVPPCCNGKHTHTQTHTWREGTGEGKQVGRKQQENKRWIQIKIKQVSMAHSVTECTHLSSKHNLILKLTNTQTFDNINQIPNVIICHTVWTDTCYGPGQRCIFLIPKVSFFKT